MSLFENYLQAERVTEPVSPKTARNNDDWLKYVGNNPPQMQLLPIGTRVGAPVQPRLYGAGPVRRGAVTGDVQDNRAFDNRPLDTFGLERSARGFSPLQATSPYANSAFSDMPVRPTMVTHDMKSYIDPITGKSTTGSSTISGYRNRLKNYFDNNPGAEDYYKTTLSSPSPSGFAPPMQAGGGGGGNVGTSPITPPQTGSSGPSSSSVYGGAALGGLLSGDLQGALQTAAGYYAGQQGIEGAMATGQAGFGLGEQIGQRAFEQSQFRPFGVTSNLANIGTTAAGGVDLRLSPSQQRLQNQLLGGAQAAASTLGGAYDPRAGQIGAQAYGLAQQQLGQVGAIDPSIAAQRGAVGGLFGQTLGQMGQPTGLEGITQAGLGGAQAQLERAGQPADIEALRSQYAGLAGAAGEGLLTSPEARQADIYEAIRATQTPEEERQRLATEERLLSQGRLGLSSAAYGGASPELLAQETARQEAMAKASLSARQQAMAEQQQGLATATGLTGLASNLAGLSSDLETAGIGRGTTLAGLGLQGAQAGRGFGQQDLANLLQLQQADIGAAGQQQALQQGRLGLGTGLFGLGTQAAQLPSQLRAADIANMQQMMAAGYLPQQQALGLFGAAELPSQLAMKGQLGGTELQAQAARSGLESYMQGANMANLLQQQQLQGMLSSVVGQQMTPQERLINEILGGTADADSGGLLGSLGFGDAPTPDWIKALDPTRFFRSSQPKEFDAGDYSQVINQDYSNYA